MSLLRALLGPGRLLAGLLLLAAFVTGGVADMRHHLTEHGCAADAGAGARDEHCTCAGLHAAPLAGHAPVALAAVLAAREPAPLAAHEAPHRHGDAHAAPRAPPRS
jgi:hypothetical protein